MSAHARMYLLEADIRNIFNQFDRDGNGYLGASDLAAVYKVLGENLDDDLVSSAPPTGTTPHCTRKTSLNQRASLQCGGGCLFSSGDRLWAGKQQLHSHPLSQPHSRCRLMSLSGKRIRMGMDKSVSRLDLGRYTGASKLRDELGR